MLAVVILYSFIGIQREAEKSEPQINVDLNDYYEKDLAKYLDPARDRRFDISNNVRNLFQTIVGVYPYLNQAIFSNEHQSCELYSPTVL